MVTSKLAKPITSGNTTITDAVSSITWKADATGKIALGQFAEFDVSAGPVPNGRPSRSRQRKPTTTERW